MSKSHHRQLRRLTTVAVAALVTVSFANSTIASGATKTTKKKPKATKAKSTTTTAAPTTATPTSAAPATVAEKKLTKLNLGVVPVIDLGVIKLGETKGFFKDRGIELNWTQLDAGPNVVTGVISKQFDIGFTAYAPPLLAVANGQPLRMVSNLAVTGTGNENGEIYTRKDSGITRFRDLTGKTLASNAPRSVLSLLGPAAVSSDGGDGTKVKIVPVPFGEMGRAVSEGKVDAAFLTEPFITKAKSEYSNLVSVGDAISFALPPESPSTLIFTSESTLKDKAEAMKAFKAGLLEAIEYTNTHKAEFQTAGASVAGLTTELAKTLPVLKFRSKITATELKPLADLMVKFNWVEKAPDVTLFIGS
jgi:NitT/TauT family transport system substrate-binding protein